MLYMTMEEMPRHFNLIGSKHIASEGEVWFDVVNPATSMVFAQEPQSSAKDVDMAVGAAKAAQREWGGMSALERGKLMFKAAGWLREHADELVELMVRETGKVIRTECQPEVALFPDTFEFFGGLAMELKGETIPLDQSMLTYTVREPLGVVAAIFP